jgi:hypothetical protein
VYALSLQLSFNPINCMFFNGVVLMLCVECKHRTRISCYKRHVHTVGILVFEIGFVRECVAVGCGMLTHTYLIK